LSGFDGDTLDESKWSYRPDGKRKGGWWSRKGISLDSDGHLVITDWLASGWYQLHYEGITAPTSVLHLRGAFRDGKVRRRRVADEVQLAVCSQRGSANHIGPASTDVCAIEEPRSVRVEDRKPTVALASAMASLKCARRDW
jgi:hypothetical protein